MYACSIFLSLMSVLEADFQEGVDLTGCRFGFFGYGSGSKSKVFEGQVQEGWQEVLGTFGLSEKLRARTAIDYQTYEKLHRLRQTHSVVEPNSEFIIYRVGDEGMELGARYYAWKEQEKSVSIPVKY